MARVAMRTHVSEAAMVSDPTGTYALAVAELLEQLEELPTTVTVKCSPSTDGWNITVVAQGGFSGSA